MSAETHLGKSLSHGHAQNDQSLPLIAIDRISPVVQSGDIDGQGIHRCEGIHINERLGRA